MTASSIQTSIRDTLKVAFSGLAASTYNSVPESVIAPAIVIVPNKPYLEPLLIGSTIRTKVNLSITAIVSYNSNPASLDNLEKLIISILGAMPSGYIVGACESPEVVQIGAAQYLSASLNVSTTYTQTN